jgi:hypothetical protein
VADNSGFCDSVIHHPVKDMQVSSANPAMRNANLDLARSRSDLDAFPDADLFISLVKRGFQSAPPICFPVS